MLKRLWAGLTNPTQVAQNAVGNVINQPVENAARQAAAKATEQVKQSAKPVVDELINQAIDSAKARVVSEGNGIAQKVMNLFRGEVEGHAKQASQQVSKKTKKTSKKINQSILPKVTHLLAKPFNWFISNFVPGVKQDVQKITRVADKRAKAVVSYVSNNISYFISSLFNIIASNLLNTLSNAIMNIGNNLLSVFGMVKKDSQSEKPIAKEPATTKVQSIQKSHKSSGRKYSAKGVKRMVRFASKRRTEAMTNVALDADSSKAPRRSRSL